MLKERVSNFPKKTLIVLATVFLLINVNIASAFELSDILDLDKYIFNEIFKFIYLYLPGLSLTIEDLNITGILTAYETHLHNLTVINKTIVNEFNATSLTCDELDVSGNAVISGSGTFGSLQTAGTVTGEQITSTDDITTGDSYYGPYGFRFDMSVNGELYITEYGVLLLRLSLFGTTANFNDLYIKTTGSLKANKMILGSNRITGVSSGGLNLTTLHYDTLDPKSPIVFELEDDIILTRVKGGEWVECNTSIKSDCPIETEQKMDKIYSKRASERVCKLNNYSWDGECYKIKSNIVQYNDAIEIMKVNETKIIDSICLELNQALQVESVYCQKIVETDKIINVGNFKSGCGWDAEIGYYCNVRETISIGDIQ